MNDVLFFLTGNTIKNQLIMRGNMKNLTSIEINTVSGAGTITPAVCIISPKHPIDAIFSGSPVDGMFFMHNNTILNSGSAYISTTVPSSAVASFIKNEPPSDRSTLTGVCGIGTDGKKYAISCITYNSYANIMLGLG